MNFVVIVNRSRESCNIFCAGYPVYRIHISAFYIRALCSSLNLAATYGEVPADYREDFQIEFEVYIVLAYDIDCENSNIARIVDCERSRVYVFTCMHMRDCVCK